MTAYTGGYEETTYEMVSSSPSGAKRRPVVQATDDGLLVDDDVALVAVEPIDPSGRRPNIRLVDATFGYEGLGEISGEVPLKVRKITGDWVAATLAR